MVGDEGISKLASSSVAVIGLGGVGAYAAEMLCRAGVGKLLLLDSDRVSITNKNRQLIALNSTVGMKKTEVLAARLKDINPEVELVLVDEYLEEDNVAQLLDNRKIDFLVDAIDTLSPKISLIKYCTDNSIKLVSSMGAGAKFDATAIRIKDLSKSFN